MANINGLVVPKIIISKSWHICFIFQILILIYIFQMINIAQNILLLCLAHLYPGQSQEKLCGLSLAMSRSWENGDL